MKLIEPVVRVGDKSYNQYKIAELDREWIEQYYPNLIDNLYRDGKTIS